MRRVLVLGPVALVLVLAACQDMREQPRMDTYESAEPFADDMEARRLPTGTLRYAPAEERAQPEAFDRGMIELGRQDFASFCSPCHGLSGRGDGIIVQRGFPKPPSFLEEKLRQAPGDHFFDVITHGHGVMYSYADRVPVEDRWAIVAYVRALQLAQPPAEAAGRVDVGGGKE